LLEGLHVLDRIRDVFLKCKRVSVENVLTLTLLILLIFGLLVYGLGKVATAADEQAGRDYALLMKPERNLQT
jgi:hypothetical protein